MKVCVLLGGDSQEREISLASGYAVSKALEGKGYFVSQVDGTLDNVRSLNALDFNLVFIALHGGDGENGNVQKVLEEKGMFYTGSDSLASKRAMDKICAKEFMIKEGIPTPEYVLLSNTFASIGGFSVRDDLFPCIVKPRYEGSSFGLSKVDKKEDLSKALENSYRYGSDVIVEKFIFGREFTVAVLDDKALPIIEIIPKKNLFDFESKYTKGKTEYIVPASLDV
ncbi:D-alanine--D-alanine ligase, partial [bacterium]|nr:D-alanine--D-alanine ligase [bacterium]